MKTASSTPLISGVMPMLKGVNQPACGSKGGNLDPPSTPCGWSTYTVTSATIAKATSVTNSIPSRNCCVRAESSIPRQQIQVMTTIQITPATVIAKVEFAALVQSTSRKV